MGAVTVAKVKRFPGQEHKDAVCYVGRAVWGWPGTPWANPHKSKPLGVMAACQNAQRAARERALADALNAFTRDVAAQPESWWAGLWRACDGGRLPLGCWCYEGLAGDGQHRCHAAILGAELDRRYGDGAAPPGA